MRSPALIPIAAVYGYGLLAGIALLLALTMPGTGVWVSPAFRAVTVEVEGRAVATLPPRAILTVAAGGRAIRLPAGELVPDYSPRGSAREIAAWFATRGAVADLIARPGATLSLPDGRTVALVGRPRRLADVPWDSWLLLAQGALMTLIGSWLVAARPGDGGARMFALSCGGLAVASLSGAVYDARELAANGALLHASQVVNFGATYVGAAALAAMFAVQPRPLVRARAALLGVLAATAWGAAAGYGWLPLGAFYLGLLALLLAFPALLIVQAARCRSDPVARAALRWIGVTTVLGVGQVTVAMSAPKLFDLPDLGGDGSTLLPMALVYGGIAFGIGRHRLFELERWTYRVIVGAAVVLGLLLLDAALVAAFDLDRPAALLLALAAAGYVYLPLRALVWRRVMGEVRLADGEKFQLAAAVAYAPTAEARRRGWRVLLRRLFEPLSVEPLSEPVAAPAVERDGAALVLPGVADDAPLRLTHRAGGTRLFGRDQLRLAEEMVALMRRADATRAEYARGVGEERQRIARDLHDDVCAMLLTSLHRDDVGKVRGDVRHAMADIRTMIGELTGERVTLDRALADLRFETSERLAAAGLALVWPLPDVPYAAELLDYTTYRALVSTVREVVSNTLKHAHAAQVWVTVTIGGAQLTIRIADDGVGLGDACAGSGRGLRNMAERMASIGGAFAIATDAGTAVTLSIPLRAPTRVTEPLESGMGLGHSVG